MSREKQAGLSGQKRSGEQVPGQRDTQGRRGREIPASPRDSNIPSVNLSASVYPLVKSRNGQHPPKMPLENTQPSADFKCCPSQAKEQCQQDLNLGPLSAWKAPGTGKAYVRRHPPYNLQEKGRGWTRRGDQTVLGSHLERPAHVLRCCYQARPLIGAGHPKLSGPSGSSRACPGLRRPSSVHH